MTTSTTVPFRTFVLWFFASLAFCLIMLLAHLLDEGRSISWVGALISFVPPCLILAGVAALSINNDSAHG